MTPEQVLELLLEDARLTDAPRGNIDEIMAMLGQMAPEVGPPDPRRADLLATISEDVENEATQRAIRELTAEFGAADVRKDLAGLLPSQDIPGEAEKIRKRTAESAKRRGAVRSMFEEERFPPDVAQSRALDTEEMIRLTENPGQKTRRERRTAAYGRKIEKTMGPDRPVSERLAGPEGRQATIEQKIYNTNRAEYFEISKNSEGNWSYSDREEFVNRKGRRKNLGTIADKKGRREAPFGRAIRDRIDNMGGKELSDVRIRKLPPEVRVLAGQGARIFELEDADGNKIYRGIFEGFRETGRTPAVITHMFERKGPQKFGRRRAVGNLTSANITPENAVEEIRKMGAVEIPRTSRDYQKIRKAFGKNIVSGDEVRLFKDVRGNVYTVVDTGRFDDLPSASGLRGPTRVSISEPRGRTPAADPEALPLADAPEAPGDPTPAIRETGSATFRDRGREKKKFGGKTYTLNRAGLRDLRHEFGKRGYTPLVGGEPVTPNPREFDPNLVSRTMDPGEINFDMRRHIRREILDSQPHLADNPALLRQRVGEKLGKMKPIEYLDDQIDRIRTMMKKTPDEIQAATVDRLYELEQTREAFGRLPDDLSKATLGVQLTPEEETKILKDRRSRSRKQRSSSLFRRLRARNTARDRAAQMFPEAPPRQKKGAGGLQRLMFPEFSAPGGAAPEPAMQRSGMSAPARAAMKAVEGSRPIASSGGSAFMDDLIDLLKTGLPYEDALKVARRVL